jgi:hypothetical protein
VGADGDVDVVPEPRCELHEAHDGEDPETTIAERRDFGRVNAEPTHQEAGGHPVPEAVHNGSEFVPDLLTIVHGMNLVVSSDSPSSRRRNRCTFCASGRRDSL